MFENFFVHAAQVGSISNPLGNLTLWGVVMNGLGIVLPVAGILLVGIFIYAGISYMISTGDPGKVKAAQAMMTNAIIGFIIISFAFVIQAIIQRGLGGNAG